MDYVAKYCSPLGMLGMVSDGESLKGLNFFSQSDSEETVLTGEHRDELPIFAEVRRWLDIYFKGGEPDFMPRIGLSGSKFQLEVWEALRRIPYGQVVTYGEIAEEIAEKRGIAKMSAQAVGGAVGRNPVGILVPCHRVIGKDGNLTGFGGGIRWKVGLLKIEGSYRDSFYIPKKGKAL